MLCGSLDGRAVWGIMDTYTGMAEFFGCSPEIITTLLTGYTPIQNKKLKKWPRFKKIEVWLLYNIIEVTGAQ